MIFIWISRVLSVLFLLCNAYQFLYLFVPLFRRKRLSKPEETHLSIAVLVAARNEQAVIGHLLDSIAAQDYPGRVTVCVVADNCTDDTAAIALAKGALVTERQNPIRVGKGYALQHLMAWLNSQHKQFDAYLVLDADNLLAPGYLAAINRGLQRHDIVTGYRAGKNFGDSWVAAGYSLWFLRTSQYLNRSRARLGTSCTVSGTGFAFLSSVTADWRWFTLTEDTEFSADMVCQGRKIGYCEDAVLYDEQPTDFATAWRQRLRWARGTYQVAVRYGGRLAKAAVRGRFAAFDILCCCLPAFVFSVAGILLKIVQGITCVVSGAPLLPVWLATAKGLAGGYVLLLVMGLVPLITEWRRIPAHPVKKIGYTLLFPLHIAANIPIALTSLFRRVTWEPIPHTRAMAVDKLINQNACTH